MYKDNRDPFRCKVEPLSMPNIVDFDILNREEYKAEYLCRPRWLCCTVMQF